MLAVRLHGQADRYEAALAAHQTEREQLEVRLDATGEKERPRKEEEEVT